MHHVLRGAAGSPAFRDAPAPYALLDTDLRIRAVNEAYVTATRRDRASMIDQILVEAFPDNPAIPSANAVRNLTSSLCLVLDSARPHSMPIQRYDVEPVRGSGRFQEKTWSPVNIPLFDDRGHVAGLVHHVDDITDLARLTALGGPAPARTGSRLGEPSKIQHLLPAPTLRDEESVRLREALIALVAARIPAGSSPVAARRRELWRAVCDRAGEQTWRGWPHAVCRTAVAALPGVAGAAITLHAGPVQQPLAASDAWTAELEELQHSVGEGPSVTAFADQLPVLVGEIAVEHGRWPGYASPAAAHGLTGVWAFPIWAADDAIGTLTLYRRESTPILSGEPADAAVLAELAGVALLADQDRITAELLDLSAPGDPYQDVSIAIGMVTIQLGVSAADALTALRARAFAAGRPLTDLARDVVSGRIRLD